MILDTGLKYLFLFTLAFVWILSAVIQDLRTREVSNWLNFSLIGIVLAYRAFWAIFSDNLEFFIFGVVGVLFFVGMAYALYYGRAFAGGDAKLLMGIGGIFPYESFFEIFIFGVGFVFLLFVLGSVYSLAYSLFIAVRNRGKFISEFKDQFVRYRFYVWLGIAGGVIFQLIIFYYGREFFGFISLIIVLFPLLFVYIKAIEKGCMIKKVNANKLMLGDWLEKDVKVGNRIIRKSVHGLSEKEILLLRKNNKEVWIREGIPFTPAFLMALGVSFIYFIWPFYL